jgi:hypothetical protein
MTNKQKAREIFATIRQQEALHGLDLETRAQALSVVLGLMNADKDSRFKGMALKAISENRLNMGL